MKTKFIHTADWQLGKPFSGIQDIDKRSTVIRKRIESLAKVGELAHENGASFVLVAGDLFDSFHPMEGVVVNAFETIGAMGLPVVAIPGNHDHGGTGGPWNLPFVRRHMEELAPNFCLLDTQDPSESDEAVILPCPLLQRHETNDPTLCFRDPSIFESLPDGKPRILLAHGTIQDFSESDMDEESLERRTPNLINLDRLPNGELDYIALGDWHGTKQVRENAWYPGTHEPDRFPKNEDYRAGNVLLVEATRGEPPVVEMLQSGSLDWVHQTFQIHEDSDLERLKEQVHTNLPSGLGSGLLQLELSGILGIGAYRDLQERLETWKAGLLRFKFKDGVQVRPDDGELAALKDREDPLVAKVANRLEEIIATGRGDAPIASAALVQLYMKVHQTS